MEATTGIRYRSYTIEQLTVVAVDYCHKMTEIELTETQWHSQKYQLARKNYHNALLRLGRAIEDKVGPVQVRRINKAA